MKLLYCAHCGDVVRLFPEKRSCLCGKSWGYYEEDNATTVQTYPSLSLGVANPDFRSAMEFFSKDPNYFSPALSIRCWVNPLSEPDVKFVLLEDEEQTPEPSTNELAAVDPNMAQSELA